jgi:hypothetical protein
MMSDQDFNINSCVRPPKLPKDLIICFDDLLDTEIKSICFRFKNEEITFSRDEILRALRDLQHVYRDGS